MHRRWLATLAAIAAAAPLTALAGPEKPKPLPDADEIVGNLECADGFYKVYHKRQEPGRHEPPVQLYVEIPTREIGQPFIVATSFSGGTTYAGWQWNEQLLTWERHGDDKLVLIEKDTHYRAEGGGTLAEVVHRTYSDRFVKAVAIIGEGHRGDNRGYLVDGKELFADSAGLFFGGMGGTLDSSVARFEELKSFPHNTEIAVTMPSRRGGEMTTLHYSLSRLPRTDYVPRVADDRVGYFLTAAKDFTKGAPSDDRFVRYVNRWDLQKMDPSLPLSPPKKPIVFYIEKTVPVRFRRFVAEGILEWNKAFEKIGFTGAVVVRQQTGSDDDPFRDFDPEDVRYNFFRWITSETPFAMGPSRVNPITGEILDADIIFDDSMVRSYLRDYNEMIKKAPETFFSPRDRRFFAESPAAHPFFGTRFGPVMQDPKAAAQAPASLVPSVEGDVAPPPGALRAACAYGDGVAHEMGLAALAAVASKDGSGQDFPEEFLGAMVKDVVMHEVGHTLGLRHNFKASTWLSLKEINEKKDGAIVGSVMDYTPINISPPGKPQGPYVTSTIGPYDYWAIEYGYKPADKEEDLKAIASRVAEKGLAYATDEDTWSPDPLVNRWDLGSDPLEFARSRVELVQKLMPSIVTRVVPQGSAYFRARRALDMLLYEYMRAAGYASRFVGGEYAHRDHKGDPNERPPLACVDPAKQREALKLVCERVFSDGAIEIPPSLVKYLAAGRWSHWGTGDWAEDVQYPVHDRILMIQRLGLSLCLSPDRLEQVDDEDVCMGTDKDVLTIPELFQTLTHAIFTEVLDGTAGARSGNVAETKPAISSIRRNLQQAYVQRLIEIATRTGWGGAPKVTRSIACSQLNVIGAKLRDTLSANGLDAYTRAHIEELQDRIKRALNAQYQSDPQQGGFMIFFGG